MTISTVPSYSRKWRSSQATDSASRWLVGSSNSNTSGFCSSNRQSATRRRSPPERFCTPASAGGQRNASIAISMVRSSSQPSTASICSCNSPCSASSVFISSSSMGSPNFPEISLNRSKRSFTPPKPSVTFSPTVFAGSNSGSCSRYPTRTPSAAQASPPDGSSLSAIIFIKVDLPAPLTPSTPILASGKKLSVTPLRISLPPGKVFDKFFITYEYW